MPLCTCLIRAFYKSWKSHVQVATMIEYCVVIRKQSSFCFMPIGVPKTVLSYFLLSYTSNLLPFVVGQLNTWEVWTVFFSTLIYSNGPCKQFSLVIFVYLYVLLIILHGSLFGGNSICRNGSDCVFCHQEGPLWYSDLYSFMFGFNNASYCHIICVVKVKKKSCKLDN